MKKGLIITGIILLISMASCVTTGGGGPAEIQLMADDAILTTDGALILEENDPYNNVGWWESTDDLITWNFNVEKPGKYKAIVNISCASSFAGATIGATVGDKTLEIEVPDTIEWSTYYDVEMGEFNLKAGENTLTVQGIEIVDRFFANIRWIKLIKG